MAGGEIRLGAGGGKEKTGEVRGVASREGWPLGKTISLTSLPTYGPRSSRLGLPFLGGTLLDATRVPPWRVASTRLSLRYLTPELVAASQSLRSPAEICLSMRGQGSAVT